MGKKMEETARLPDRPLEPVATRQQVAPARARALIGGAIAYLLCICVSITPLLHLAGKSYLLSIPTNPLLLLWGAWLPYDLHVQPMHRASMFITNDIEFSLLLVLEFGIYTFCAFFVYRLAERGDYRRIIGVIIFGAIVFGFIHVLTPAMLSRDIFVYAGYGRTIVAHHANPYFVPLSAYPKDPLTPFDDWNFATSAYGPVWLAVCSLWALLSGSFPLGYIFAFRLFGMAARLTNIWLVAAILKKMGHSPRTVTLGMLLYAWNPLVLLESCQGAHNDTFMVTLLLLGFLLTLRAEHRGFARPAHYLPPIIVFTLAVLVKFTAAPLIFFFLVLMIRRAHSSNLLDVQDNQSTVSRPWRRIFPKVLLAAITSGLLAWIFYAPFWIRHSIRSIISSFSSPPSAYFSENSLLRVMHDWVKLHGLPARTSWSYLPIAVLSNHATWNVINLVALLCALCIGAVCLWRMPTTRMMILASLATLGLLLVVTPWFFSWYVTWLVGLAAISLPTTRDRFGRALVAFALTFSATAFDTYFVAIGGWGGFNWIMMIGLPLVVFIFFLNFKKGPDLHSLETTYTTTQNY